MLHQPLSRNLTTPGGVFPTPFPCQLSCTLPLSPILYTPTIKTPTHSHCQDIHPCCVTWLLRVQETCTRPLSSILFLLYRACIKTPDEPAVQVCWQSLLVPVPGPMCEPEPRQSTPYIACSVSYIYDILHWLASNPTSAFTPHCPIALPVPSGMNPDNSNVQVSYPLRITDDSCILLIVSRDFGWIKKRDRRDV